MERIIVLGIGNQLMMDDGIGIYLVEELEKLDKASNIHYLIGESDIDYCIEKIEEATYTIILDAVYSGKETGELSIYPLSNVHEYQTLDISPHNLHLFQVLYQQRKTIRGFLIGIEPYEISFQIGISQNINEKWNQILREVKETIMALIAKEKEMIVSE